MGIDIEALWKKQEELNPELAEHLAVVPMLGQALQHPLVYSVPYHPQMNALLNEQFRIKQQEMAKCLAQKKYGTILSLYERPYRLEVLWGLRSKMSKRKFAEEFAWVWMDSENIWQNKPLIDAIIQHLGKKHLRFVMTPEERNTLRHLGSELRVFRGCMEHNREGISWTLDEKVAHKLYRRFRNKTYIVRCGYVLKENVLFLKEDRDESEIVVRDSSLVRDVEDSYICL